MKASIPSATSHWFEAKPVSRFQLENKRYSRLRVIICLNDRGRLTVLDFNVRGTTFLIQEESGTIKFDP